jgi:hypothetical protein
MIDLKKFSFDPWMWWGFILGPVVGVLPVFGFRQLGFASPWLDGIIGMFVGILISASIQHFKNIRRL